MTPRPPPDGVAERALEPHRGHGRARLRAASVHDRGGIRGGVRGPAGRRGRPRRPRLPQGRGRQQHADTQPRRVVPGALPVLQGERVLLHRHQQGGEPADPGIHDLPLRVPPSLPRLCLPERAMRPGWGRVPHHPRRHLPQPAASPILPVQPRGRVLPDALLAVFPVVTGQAGARFQALAGDARVLQPKAAADRSGHSDNHLAGGCRQGGAPAGHHAAVHREGPQRARHRGQDPAQGELPARHVEQGSDRFETRRSVLSRADKGVADKGGGVEPGLGRLQRNVRR